MQFPLAPNPGFAPQPNRHGKFVRPDVSEQLIREALHPYKGLLIATKAGLERPGPNNWALNGRPDYLIEETRPQQRLCEYLEQVTNLFGGEVSGGLFRVSQSSTCVKSFTLALKIGDAAANDRAGWRRVTSLTCRGEA